jgi:hypothetical protein
MGGAWTVLSAIIGFFGGLVLSRLRPREHRSIRLQEKKAEAIEGLYRRLVNLGEKLFPILKCMYGPHGPNGRNEKSKAELGKALENLERYFRYKRLYFDAQTRDAMQKVFAACTLADMNSWAWDQQELRYEDRLKAAEENDGPIREQIEQLLIGLENRFRLLLGADGWGESVSEWFRVRVLPDFRNRLDQLKHRNGRKGKRPTSANA